MNSAGYGSNWLASWAREVALTLTSWPSVTGSAEEADFAPRLTDMLSRLGTSWTEAIPGDPRRNVFALKRGAGRRTIVLTGHFDVVPVEDYGALKPLALAPEAEYRFYVAAQAAERRSGVKSIPFFNSAKHTRASLRPSATKAAVVLMPR